MAVEIRRRTCRRAKAPRKNGDGSPSTKSARAGGEAGQAKTKGKGRRQRAEHAGLRRAGSTPDGKDAPRAHTHFQIDRFRRAPVLSILWRLGADVIKFTATAGVLSEEESVGAPQFSFDEMKAIVDEAAMWGRKVAAHAHGTDGIKRAVRAGVASIEHGSLLDDEAVALMKQHGTFLVPTVYVGESVMQNGQRWGLPEKLLAKARLINAQKNESMRKAIRGGVKIAYGTDAGVFAHGLNASDFRLLVDLGMTPMQAIQSATMVAADLLGQTNHLGSLQPGGFADLVAVPTDPLQNISVLEKVPFVMKGGTVYKDTITERRK